MSNYTLEQKALAFIRGQLWWFNKKSVDPRWSNVSKDLNGEAEELHLYLEGFEYHIGPTPPKELTETELELVEMLERLLAFNDRTRTTAWKRAVVENEAEALAKKVRGAA